jgi:opacity protein-like surface antigen
MNKKIVAIAVVLIMAGVWASSALALDPMGPPTAGLRQGGVSVGIDYLNSQMHNKFKYEGETMKVKGNRVEKTYANLGYGVADNWEVYGRLGASRAEAYGLEFVFGGYRPAWGLGTKVTIAQSDNLKWGALFQISWNQSKLEWNEGGDYEKMKWYEYQIAVGPTYKLTDKVSIYGGPFYNYLDGDLSDEDGKWGDINSTGHVGGYIGAQFAVNDNLALNAEYQLSTDESGLGLQLVWKF